MLIGIVSKDEHIKIHAQALRKDGFSVVGLGSSPTQIPPTVDLVILRTQSCSHGGSDTAFSWSRSTKRPLIVENGLTGIRSKLRFYAPKTTTPQVEFEPMTAPNKVKSAPNNVKTTPEVAPTPVSSVLQYTHTFPEGCADFRALPSNRLKRSFEEALPILEEMPEDLRAEIRSTFKKALQKNKGPFFPNISTYYSRKEFLVLDKLTNRPIHFFLVLQWLALGFVDSAPTTRNLRDAYMDFCGAGSVKSYAEAAIWIVENGSKPSPALLPVEIGSVTPAAALTQEEFDNIFADLMEDSEPPKTETPKTEIPKTETPMELSGIRRDLEDFILEIAGTNAEVLKGVKNILEELAQLRPLRDEVKALRNEVTFLREELLWVHETLSLVAENKNTPNVATSNDTKPLDAIQVLEDLRDRGALINISFGPK